MLGWLVDNIATILVLLGLLAILGAIVWSMIRKKKRGETSCGCGCSNCAMRETCHAPQEKKNQE